MSKINLISIADTPDTQQMGLQFVRTMNADDGMLFKFPTPKVLSFWMQNTYLPLEIAFIDQTNKIVKTEKMIPLSTRSVTSGSPCLMALEVMNGTFDRLGIQSGYTVTLSPDGKAVTFEK